MKSHARLFAFATVASLALAGTAQAQTYTTTEAPPPPPQQQPAPMRTSGAGVVIQARMTAPVSTKHSDPGDRFHAEVVSPVVDQRGRVLVPAGAHVIGHVLVAERGHHTYGRANIILGVEALRVHGHTIPIAAQATAPMDTWRSGVRMRERGEIPEGSPVQIQLTGPLPVAALRDAIGNHAYGGGP
jgi:hypothetical protein